MLNIRNRLKNYAFWIALLLGFIPLTLDALNFYNLSLILPPNWEQLIKSGMGLLVLLGILNNPDTTNRGFGDEPSTTDHSSDI